MRLLLVEDEEDLAIAVKRGLEQHGFVVDVAEDGDMAWGLALNGEYAGIVLDRGLPDGDGLQLCQRMRATGSLLPILMLTARDGLGDRVAGLNAGADDYLIKPFELPELVARLRAILRRSSIARTNVLAVRDLTLDLDSGIVGRDGRTLALTSKEFLVLAHLMRHAGRVVSGDQLLVHAWDDAVDASGDTVRTHMKNLRRKIDGGGATKLIHTVHGRGYVVGP
ncbi:MAG: response regulator transcription factor [Candidatus Sericytochromatia bacterium]|nr:response regulator transcription factor [Candidatus Sericytochromatia bacterium]